MLYMTVVVANIASFSPLFTTRVASPCPRGDFAQADLIVSELLGSFGDNELSPECLDGAGPRQGEGPPPRWGHLALEGDRPHP